MRLKLCCVYSSFHLVSLCCLYCFPKRQSASQRKGAPGRAYKVGAILKKNIHDLPDDRLGSLDEKGHRQFIHPADVRGFFRDWRTRIYWIFIFIFLVLPWVRLNGHQAILLNLPERRFAIFGVTFWAHDGPIIFFILLIALMGLAFVTAIWGRVWCGWACPQTVFIDAVYRKIESIIEGNPVERRRLDKAPWSLNKIIKRALKWFFYLAAS